MIQKISKKKFGSNDSKLSNSKSYHDKSEIWRPSIFFLLPGQPGSTHTHTLTRTHTHTHTHSHTLTLLHFSSLKSLELILHFNFFDLDFFDFDFFDFLNFDFDFSTHICIDIHAHTHTHAHFNFLTFLQSRSLDLILH